MGSMLREMDVFRKKVKGNARNYKKKKPTEMKNVFDELLIRLKKL